MKSLNFEFLRDLAPELADLGGFAEKYLHEDPASAVGKLRLLAENLVERIYQTHQLPKPIQAKFIDLLTNDSFTSIVAPV
ncbi:MAG: hypothetical protein U9R69_03040, partial [Thermodesulfobacteriota bacterium]|nr:hypothetical protein [Thermodesulfobacteriota bacterium]